MRPFALLCLFLLSILTVSAQNRYVVHVAYIVPADRQPTPDYQAKVTRVIKWVQGFYADQMEAQGFGRMTFTLETDENDNVVVHGMNSPLTAAQFAGEGHTFYSGGTYSNNMLEALKANGVTPYKRGEIWIVFADAQDQNPDGSIHLGTTQGSSAFESGAAFCSSQILSLATPENVHDLSPYDGKVLDAIGKIPLVARKSFPWYEGDSVASISCSEVGALCHEAGHCFMLQHTYLNDDNFNGIMMGNGFRGFRGYMMPADYPDDDVRLSRPSALILSLSPFFRTDGNRLEAHDPPRVVIDTPPGEFRLAGGKLHLDFTAMATNGPGIALATLENGVGRDGVGVVAYKEFSGNPIQVDAFIETPRITLGREDKWKLRVFDAAGNVTESFVTLKAPAEGLAPQPFIHVAHNRVKVGTEVQFSGSAALPGTYTYSWTFGDGSKAIGEKVAHTFLAKGVFEVKLKVTDQNGLNETISQFMSVRKDGPSRI